MTKFEWQQKVAYRLFETRIGMGLPSDPVADWYLAESILVLVPDASVKHYILGKERLGVCIRSPEYLRSVVKSILGVRASNARHLAISPVGPTAHGIRHCHRA